MASYIRSLVFGIVIACCHDAIAQGERPFNAGRPAPFPDDRNNIGPMVRPERPAAHSFAAAQPVEQSTVQSDPTADMAVPTFISPATVATSLKMLALVTVMGLVPSIAMMTTCFVRFTVVLGLLRQALGTPQALPNQIVTALGLFMTFLVMAPVWQSCYDDGIRPYTQPADGTAALDEATAFLRTMAPLRSFMSRQIDRAGNADGVWMLIDFQRPDKQSPGASNWTEPQSYDDVPLTVLIPAYLLSELKVSFLIGFQLFLPFLVIDLVVASILTSLGLSMLPPSLVSLPFKLLLFVLIDGWFLTIGMLLESVRLT